MIRMGEYQFTLKYFHSGSGMPLKLKTLSDNEEQIMTTDCHVHSGGKWIE